MSELIITCDQCKSPRELNSIYCYEHICGYCKHKKNSLECIFQEYGFTCYEQNKNEKEIVRSTWFLYFLNWFNSLFK